MDWQGLANWRICVGKKNWPPIGTGLAWIDMDWQGLANWRICVGTKNWPPIGTGLAWIDMDWQIGEFVSEQKIGPRLAPDWHGLTWIDMDWHGLARIGMD